FGDSYETNGTVTDHSLSSNYTTDGGKSLRISQPHNTFAVGTQVLYNHNGVSTDEAKFNALTGGTKLLIDVTTPPHGPSYQTLDAQLNFGGGSTGTFDYHYMSAYGGNFYQFVTGNPGGDNT